MPLSESYGHHPRQTFSNFVRVDPSEFSGLGVTLKEREIA